MTTSPRRIFVISDLHLGGDYGEETTDRGFRICTRVDQIRQFVDELTAIDPREVRVELVINGDIVDFLAERNENPLHWVPFESRPDQAIRKLKKIVTRDEVFFNALSRFLNKGHRLVVLPGNHDIELTLPDVRKHFESVLGVRGDHDYQFLYDGEAYTVGNVLIEHGNRYDGFNVVNHDQLRRLRSLQSRRQSTYEYKFTPPPGSKMVSDVMNPIKKDYSFIDLLKPEVEAAIPVLLALEPGYRSKLRHALNLRREAGKHAPKEPGLPRVVGDISADLDLEGFVDPGSPEADVSSGHESDEVSELLSELMGEAAAEDFQLGLQNSTDEDKDAGEEISLGDTVNRLIGVARMALSGKSSTLEKRIPALLQALRTLQNSDTFRIDEECETVYLEAAEALSRNGFELVIFGHTHMARDVKLKNGQRYLNTGTWADVLEFPEEIITGSDDEARKKVLEFVNRIGSGDFSGWTLFRPTYVRIDMNGDDKLLDARLIKYRPPTASNSP